jgi:tetratricopeptide (TPR) repeat protein
VSIAGIGIIAWCAEKDIERNAQWKNSDTLFLADVTTVPNSCFTNGNAGSAYNNLSLLPENKDRINILVDSAITYLNKSVAIHPKYVNGYLQLGLSYSLIKEYDKGIQYLDSAKAIYPNDPDLKAMFSNVSALYNNEGITLVNTQPQKALDLFKKAVSLAPDNVSSLNDLAYAYGLFDKEYDSARKYWSIALQFDPANKIALAGIASLPKKQ